jgi:hypothetical protein
MIYKQIIIQKESKIKYLIKQLNAKGIYKGPKGEQLQSLDYFSLLRLLAVKRAVES